MEFASKCFNAATIADPWECTKKYRGLRGRHFQVLKHGDSTKPEQLFNTLLNYPVAYAGSFQNDQGMPACFEKCFSFGIYELRDAICDL